MNPIEKLIRIMMLPLAVSLASLAMWWVWKTYPFTERAFLTNILPIYSLYLTITAVSYKVLSGEIKQFMVATTFVSSLFMIELFLRVLLDIRLF